MLVRWTESSFEGSIKLGSFRHQIQTGIGKLEKTCLIGCGRDRKPVAQINGPLYFQSATFASRDCKTVYSIAGARREDRKSAFPDRPMDWQASRSRARKGFLGHLPIGRGVARAENRPAPFSICQLLRYTNSVTHWQRVPGLCASI